MSITVTNPILPGCHPDPAIARRGSEYFIATSTFEWLPALQIHRSTNLRDWTIAGHAVEDDRLGLRGVPDSCGVWAPCLTVHPSTGRFYLAYSIMKTQDAEVFDVDNYFVWADEIEGPWSEPIYVTSLGFDGSIFHDDDGSSWFVCLEWETRPGREHPGWIVVQSLDLATGAVGDPVRISRGSTDRGALEAPHIYRHDGWYYLMTAEGGTGYGHGVALSRSRNLLGAYESDPSGVFLTASSPSQYAARGLRDFLRPQYFSPGAPMQKAGHGSLVEGADGRWYLAHLASRPVGEKRSCILGRETSLQPVEWDDDGWLRLVGGGVMPLETFEVDGDDAPAPGLDLHETFEKGLAPEFVVPRMLSGGWREHGEDGLRLRGRDSLHSRFDVSLVATRRRGMTGTATTSMEFTPDHFRQDAGLSVFYNASNFAHLRVTWSEDAASPVIGIRIARTSASEDAVIDERVSPAGPLDLRVDFAGTELRFAYRPAGGDWTAIGGELDGAFLSDDDAYGFTGQFIGLSATDAIRHAKWARFAHLDVRYS